MRSTDSLAIVALVTWLLAESLGIVMLRSWITSGAARSRRKQAGGMSLPVLLGHAGLAFTGFVCWVSFLLTTSPVPAWLAIAFMAPAIGLGASTVTVWTPYPVRRAAADLGKRSMPDRARRADGMGGAPGVISDQVLARALDDEMLAGQLVDELLAHNLGLPPARAHRRPDMRPLIPVAHGLLAIATFMLATLAATAAT
jgi:hypothetical protein